MLLNSNVLHGSGHEFEVDVFKATFEMTKPNYKKKKKNKLTPPSTLVIFRLFDYFNDNFKNDS